MPETPVAELCRAHHVESSDGQHICGCESEVFPFFELGEVKASAEAGEIHSVSGDARPHSFSRFLLREDGDAGRQLPEAVQSYQTGARL